MCVLYVVSTQSFGAHQKGKGSNRFSIYGTANSAVAVVVVGKLLPYSTSAGGGGFRR